MKVWQEPIEFEWDKGNIEKNWKKHTVSYAECEEIFSNEPLLIIGDEKHSTIEKRYLIIGITNKKRILSIIITVRKNKVRVISARDAHIKERKKYETT